MTPQATPTSRHVTHVRTTDGREHQFLDARFVIHDDNDLSIYRPDGSEMWAGFARGHWVSVHNDRDQPEQVDGPLSQVVAETIAREIEAEHALVNETAHSEGAETVGFLGGLTTAAMIARQVGQTLSANPPSTDREGSPQ